MANTGVTLDTSGLKRITERIARLSPKEMEKLRKRANASVARAMKAEAARAISEIELNLSPRQISRYLQTKLGHAGDVDYVSVFASDTRLPLTAFKPRFSKSSGVSVTTWRDSPAYVLPHGFRRNRNQVWQRIPGKGPSGLVGRLPIVQRKGPSLKRALQKTGPQKAWKDHGRQQVVDRIKAFGQEKLASEIRRLLTYV